MKKSYALMVMILIVLVPVLVLAEEAKTCEPPPIACIVYPSYADEGTCCEEGSCPETLNPCTVAICTIDKVCAEVYPGDGQPGSCPGARYCVAQKCCNEAPSCIYAGSKCQGDWQCFGGRQCIDGQCCLGAM